MIRDFDDNEKDQLREIVAEELPIFVLGPGAYRVGFDSPENPGWGEIELRVAELLGRVQHDEYAFLKEFFRNKFSYQRRSGPDQDAASDRIGGLVAEAKAQWAREHELASMDHTITLGWTPKGLTSFRPWRTLLAAEILKAYRHASCCLGLEIGKGRSPVLHWQEAKIPSQVIAEWSRPSSAYDQPADAGDVAEYHFHASQQAIRAASRLARAMDELRRARRISSEQSAALDGLSLGRVVDLEESVQASLAKVLEYPLQVLLPLRMAAMLDVLEERCFNKPFEPLQGENVEWLGDLLWHVLSSDAGVQPSQSDIAFFVSLSEEGLPRLPDLRRPAFGDRAARDRDVTRLAKRGQFVDRPANAEQDQMLRTIALCLYTQYQIVEFAKSVQERAKPRIKQGGEYTREELKLVAVVGRHAIAMVGDYGDKFEQALLNLLGRDVRFYIAVPVWLTTTNAPRRIDWLLATVTKDGRDKATVAWAWLADVQKVSGPIVIKLNGCDRPPLGSDQVKGLVSEFAFEVQSSRHQGASMDLAVLYDEHDRLMAMQSFDELIGGVSKGGLLASDLGTPDKGLAWQGRSWVMMGQRFADWIPRLSLFTRMWVGSKDNKPAAPTNYWAFDRSFDWPERSLLGMLGITMMEGDVGAVTNALSVEAFQAWTTDSPLGKRFRRLFEEVG